MLINFSVANFTSFKEKTTFSMLPGKISKQHNEHILSDESHKLLKGATIYGANASGKSNLVKAITALYACIINSNTKCLIAHQFKLQNLVKDIEFEVDFQINKKVYRYSLISDGYNISKEQLSLITKSGSFKHLFTRINSDVELGSYLKPSEDWYKNRTFQSFTPLLSKMLQDGILENQEKISGSEHIVNTLNFFRNLIIVTSDSSVNPFMFASQFNTSHEFKHYLNKLLNIADLGINDIKWVKLSREETENYYKSIENDQRNHDYGTVFLNSIDGDMIAIDLNSGGKQGFVLKTIHNNIEFNLKEESDGTRRLIDLALSLFYLSKPDICLIIDEMDCRLHPSLSKFLISSHMNNTKQKGQLIVTLHDLNLMTNELWRTDEIWFTEKRLDGSTDLYSLYQFKPRFDKNLQNGYLQGKYGAIPMIGDFDYE